MYTVTLKGIRIFASRILLRWPYLSMHGDHILEYLKNVHYCYDILIYLFHKRIIYTYVSTLIVFRRIHKTVESGC